MAKKSLEDLNVQARDKVIVRGKVAFSEIATRVEGERLAEKVKRQEAKGFKFPETKPHYALALVDVSVKDEFQGTPLATYIGQDVYKNKDNKHALQLVSKSPFAPSIYHIVNGEAVKLDGLDAELAPGQEVEVLIEAYKPKQFNRLGSSFNAVMLAEGNIQYYGNNAVSEIEAFGVKPAASVKDAPATPAQPAEQSFAPESTATAETFGSTIPADALPEIAATNEAPASTGGMVDNPFG